MNENHTQIYKTEFVTSFFCVSISDLIFIFMIIHSLAGVMYSDPTGPSFTVHK
jgi:hypothetical protein